MRKLTTYILIILAFSLVSGGVVQAGTTEIRVQVAAVRILELDKHDNVSKIYSNTDSNITPQVHKYATTMPYEELTPETKKHYNDIVQKLNKQQRGLVYKRQVSLVSSFSLGLSKHQLLTFFVFVQCTTVCGRPVTI